MSARANGLAVVASALLAQACVRAQPDGEAQPTPSATLAVATAPAPATPVDHLAPGELVEGPREAFGIALPRDLQVTASFVDAVSAKGPVSVHSLVQYLGARLAGGSLREGTEAASFEHVTARGKPESRAPGAYHVRARRLASRDSQGAAPGRSGAAERRVTLATRGAHSAGKNPRPVAPRLSYGPTATGPPKKPNQRNPQRAMAAAYATTARAIAARPVRRA